MYSEEIGKLATAAQNKLNLLKSGKGRYLLASCLAGMYVGLGILLIFTIGGALNQANSPAVRLVMGLSFGVALSLVIMAGSELFTGNNLVMTVGQLENKVGFGDVIAIYLVSFLGNLLGSVLLAVLFAYSGLLTGPTGEFIAKTAAVKMALPWPQLLIRAILCNTLVCLAVWCSFKMKEEAGKLIMIFWCLFAFITTGFEHSVANMTLLAASLFVPGAAGVSIGGFAYNLLWVTLGNFVGGALFVGFPYWYISKKE